MERDKTAPGVVAHINIDRYNPNASRKQLGINTTGRGIVYINVPKDCSLPIGTEVEYIVADYQYDNPILILAQACLGCRLHCGGRLP